MKWRTLLVMAVTAVLLTVIGGVTGVALVAQSAVRAVLIKDVDNPIRQPVVLRGELVQAAAATQFGEASIDYTVPAGKRLVVEFVSGVARLDASPDRNYVLHIRQPGGGTLDEIFLPMQLSGSRFVSQSLRLYYDPGMHFVVNCGRDLADAPASNYSAFASGYLVDTAY